MTRLVALLTCTLAAEPLFAQGFRDPIPTPPPVPVRGTRMLYPAASPFTPPVGIGQYGLGRYTGLGYVPGFSAPVLYGYGGFVYGPNPGFTGLGPLAVRNPYLGAYGTSRLPDPAVQLPNLVPADPAPDLRLPAEFTVEFPAPVQATVNGTVTAKEAITHTFTSPPLRPGERHTFAVSARWATGTDEYEWDRTVVVESGQRSRAVVAAGFKVMK
jgi:uncharacterized protein (TIGR03000 family)